VKSVNYEYSHYAIFSSYLLSSWRNGYNIITGKLEGNRSLGKSRSRWEGNIKMHLKEMGERGCEGVDWINLAQNRVQ